MTSRGIHGGAVLVTSRIQLSRIAAEGGCVLTKASSAASGNVRLATTFAIVDLANLNPVGRAGQCVLNAPIGNGSRSARRGRQAAVSAQVPGEEAQRVLRLERRDVPVLAGVGVQRLLG